MAAALKAGEILITRTTDIGWTPLFHLAAAVVTEIGAPTSHAAIVARELGVPAVVNVDRVTERVGSGDELFVDGWAGLVGPRAARRLLLLLSTSSLRMPILYAFARAQRYSPNGTRQAASAKC